MSRSNKKRVGIISEAAGTYPQKPYSTRQRKLMESIELNDNIDIAFENAPIVSGSDALGAAYAGGDAKTVSMIIDGKPFEQTNIGAKTIISPLQTATGLNVALDQVDNEGCEINNGILSNSPAAYVVGSGGYDYVAECTVNIADVSGSDDCAFGMRKAEAHQAALDDYDEMAVLNVISGSVKAETILNDGTTSTSAALATVADGVDVTLRLVVKQSGVVEFYVDGVKGDVNFTFDSGEVIVPFFQFLHATTSPGNIILSSWKAGKY